MLTKFETKSFRVKGLSFHPTRPWILCSLHNGWIQLYDYRMKLKLDQFEEHEGPVRGIHFHPTKDFFVSGGDDYKIKIWNHKLRRCMFTLGAHLDYVRTVEFHPTHDWVASASDDQTVNVWNWRTREKISTLAGHNHYVMCARFHPSEDLLVSASLDQTIRVWDLSGLVGSGSASRRAQRGVGGRGRGDSGGLANRLNQDLFGGSDAVVKFVLEGHDRGVNWASFHPTLPLIVSGADDNQVKLWRMNDTKAWEMDTMRGHGNNVSCVIFHQGNDQDLIISNSEDRTIRVWDVSKRMPVQTHRREHDRFWIVDGHPTRNLLAAGHDSGMVIFKLRRERPALDFHRGQVFYVKDRYLRKVVLQSSGGEGVDTPIMALGRSPTAGSSRSYGGSSISSTASTEPRVLHYNHMNNSQCNVLVHSRAEGGSYELFVFPKGSGRGSSAASQQRSFRGYGKSVVFVEWNKFCVLSRDRQTLTVCDLRNEATKKISPLPHPGINGLFPSGVASRMILRSDDTLWLFEHTSRNVLAEINVAHARRVSWNKTASMCAIMSKNAVVLVDRNLAQLCVQQEPVSVKSGAWDECGVFVYTTLSHVKYLLPSGDGGIIRTLEEVVYATAVNRNVLHCVDRKCRPQRLRIDPTEYRFKMSLEKQRFREVLRIIRTSNSLCGSAIIAYLQKKGFPEVALHFVKDNNVKFDLALECGNIEIALEAATALDDPQCWQRLGEAALLQGNHETVEMAYQHTKNFEKLSFLYLITGNIEKLRKMSKIAEHRRDVMSQCHNALYLGDIAGNVNLFGSVGQKTLAYLAAKTHGLDEAATKHEKELKEANLTVPKTLPGAKWLRPPKPILKEDNWPLLDVKKSVFDPTAFANAGTEEDEEANGSAAKHADDDWNVDDDDLDLDDELRSDDDDANDGDVGDDGGAWGMSDSGLSDLDDELNDGDDDDKEDAREGRSSKTEAGVFVAPAGDKTHAQCWSNGSTLALDHVAAGEFESAMDLLSRQIGAADFKPLKEKFLETYAAVRVSLPGLASSGGIPNTYLLRDAQDESARSVKETLPRPLYSLAHLVGRLKEGYRRFQKGQFGEAKSVFLDIVLSIPLVVVDERSEAAELKELVGFCKEYLVFLKLSEKRKSIKERGGSSAEQSKLVTELAAYGTHCVLQPPHLVLALMVAMTQAFKLKNYITAASFARRLLETSEGGAGGNKTVAAAQKKAQKVLKLSERKGVNAVKLDYDERAPFSICAKSLAPIYKGSKKVACPYCFATYKPEYVDEICGICGIGKIGLETIGLVSYSEKRFRKTVH